MMSAISTYKDPWGDGDASPALGEFSSLLAIGSGRATTGCLLGEWHVEDSPGISNIGFNRSSSISSVMLRPVIFSLGYSVTECWEETSVDDHRGMAPGESPWVVLGRVICSQVLSLVDSASKSGSLGRVTCTGSKPLFKPSGYITTPPE